ncbi:MAG: precorrin-8X methylmutase [Firmicutes bacterium]|nr:precorrin-8X methylmutase [Bacillota bacterium]
MKQVISEVGEPRAIEERSMQIIGKLLEGRELPPGEESVTKRVVHATADVEYADLLQFHPHAVGAGLEAIRAGYSVVADVNMVKAGINSAKLRVYGGEVRCFVAEPRVVEEAQRRGVTRARVAMRFAAEDPDNRIYVIGNSPTALFELCDLIAKGKISPALVIGTPVGFVGAAESKGLLTTLEIPYIITRGPKGGSSVAVAIFNALLYMLN